MVTIDLDPLGKTIIVINSPSSLVISFVDVFVGWRTAHVSGVDIYRRLLWLFAGSSIGNRAEKSRGWREKGITRRGWDGQGINSRGWGGEGISRRGGEERVSIAGGGEERVSAEGEERRGYQ